MTRKYFTRKLNGIEADYYICRDWALCVVNRYRDTPFPVARVRRLKVKVTEHGLVQYFRFRGELVEIAE